jgi:hypothetical protein
VTTGLLHLHHPQLDDDSDGAVSAPELSEKQKQLQRLTQQQQQLLYGVRAASSAMGPAGVHQPIGGTGNFTSAEYKAWMQRAPSTSAIYERLRQGRQQQQTSASDSERRTGKLTFSAENLVDKSKQQVMNSTRS